MIKKILLSILVISAVSITAFGATRAYFSDEGTSNENVFSSGTLDMALNNDGDPSYTDDVASTWSSPEGWAPGDKFSYKLNFTNKGSIDILELLMNFNIVSRDTQGDASHLDDAIYVSRWEECFDGHCVISGPNVGDFLSAAEGQCDSGLDGHLYLSELASCSNWFNSGAPGPVTQDDESTVNDGILMEAGNKKDYSLNIEFTFDPDAGNEYQGDSVVMEAVFTGYQNFEWFNNLTGVTF